MRYEEEKEIQMTFTINSSITLNNGVEMPRFGLGVWQAKEGNEVVTAVSTALEAGYRHIDTAALYGNEEGVGTAVRQSGIPRAEIFITTKVWNSDQRDGNVQGAFETSLQKLGMDYVDLYLIHWPVKGYYVDTWRELEKIYASGRAKAIGVSNFHEHHLQDIFASSELVPAVNQIELHPRLRQTSLDNFCQQHGIAVEAWSPLMQARILDNPTLQQIAEAHGKTTAQVIIRWDLQRGLITIPKSVTPSRIRANADVYDFALSDADMAAIDALDQHQRIGPDPDDFSF